MLCELVKKSQITPSVYDFTVDSAEMAKDATAGQFLHVLCGGKSYLRRPISICDVINNRFVRFIFEVRGEGTAELAKAKIGDKLDILGALGHGFDISDVGDGAVLLIGGGIGVFPLLKLAKDLGGNATAVLGYRDKSSVMLAEEFSRSCKNVFVATDDGSCGFHGYVTELMENIIRTNKVTMVYTCGPKPMMKFVADIANKNDIKAQVSMEERMGCGVGACVTCTCNVSGEKKRVCKDGPVFYASEVEFDG
ncbi:MAG: dihydroorotate dehydrogenase electron transfer subunit [Oscillospiraceae bacterium]